MAELDRMLEANAQYAAQAPGGLPAPPARAVAVVACMDARMDVFRILGLQPGDAHVIRNAGGVVTQDTLRSVTVSQHVLGTREVVLVHHTRCGMEGADEAALLDRVEQATGARPDWPVQAFADVEEDVRESVRQLRACPYLLSRDVRGTVYDVDTGLLREVVVPD
ncbi:carbonic anhydrase [Geodermatophilus pulveris]|uniref:carbonic anhydrase n=1 Tax=Geodermatophilus pulveris TaxID=1564159 RepID=A0A239AUZ0_9ACTN|nr:carbonic anhydrase [Geodermatophilus pulveris]SNR98778.1 carbonic anhydrase [Geodermatophilus pulveris]